MDALYEAGPVKPDPVSGVTALEWVDLQAYAALTGEISEPWEAKALRAMSRAYKQGLDEGKSPFSEMPSERGKA